MLNDTFTFNSIASSMRPSSMLTPARLCKSLHASVGASARRALATAASSGQPLTIKPSPQEIASARLGQRSIQRALEALTHDGLVVVEDVVDPASIDALNAVMVKDARTLMARGEAGPFNYNLGESNAYCEFGLTSGNLQQSPPFDPAVFAPSIFTNPIATQITNAWLGERPTMSFISSNVAVKAEVGQPVHSDADFDHPTVSLRWTVKKPDARSPSLPWSTSV